MNKNWVRPVIFLLLIIISTYSYAENVKVLNALTNHSIKIEDDAILLNEDDYLEIENAMLPLTAYGNVGFVTQDIENEEYVTEKARSWGNTAFETGKPYMVFMIDMAARQLGVWVSEPLSDFVKSDKINEILDTTYKHATEGDYKACAVHSFNQMYLALYENQPESYAPLNEKSFEMGLYSEQKEYNWNLEKQTDESLKDLFKQLETEMRNRGI